MCPSHAKPKYQLTTIQDFHVKDPEVPFDMPVIISIIHSRIKIKKPVERKHSEINPICPGVSGSQIYIVIWHTNKRQTIIFVTFCLRNKPGKTF